MYNGKNMGGIRIPKVLIKSIRNKQYTNNQSKKKSNKVKPYVSLTELGIPLDLNFFRQSILHSSNGKFNTIAETTLDDVRRECFDIKMSCSVWTEEKIIEEVKKYKTKSEFRINANGAYQRAKKLGILNEITKNLKGIIQTKWTLELLKKESKKYKTRTEFAKLSSAAYCYAYKYKLLDKICKHMNSRLLTISELKKEALKFNSRAEFQRNSKVYQYARRRGLLNDICKHMMSYQEAMAKAKGYSIK